MRYIWSTAHPRRRVMHIENFSPSGEELWQPLCGRVPGPFNRSINAPWGLGRRICKWCKKVAV